MGFPFKKSSLHFKNVVFKYKFLTILFLWPFNPHVWCPKFCGFALACEVELDLMQDLNVEFEHKVEHEEI